MEKVSIIIPVYNVKKYLKRCIDCVKKQTYKNIEIILVDDGSTDGSSEICDEAKKTDERIVVLHKKNGGLSSARNAGVKVASGNYICFIDSDDTVDEDYVETLYETIKKYKTKLAVVSHRVFYTNNKTAIDMSTGESGRIENTTAIKKLLYSDGIDTSTWAKMFSKDILEKHQFPEGRNFEDAATTYLYFDEVKYIGLNSVPKYNYYIRNTSISQKPFDKSKMDLITSTQEMYDYITEKYPKMKSGAERRLMYAYLSTLRQIALSPETLDSIECLPEVWHYIKTHRVDVMLDTKIPDRDRKALISTRFGYGAFKITLKMYEKFRHIFA